MSHNILYATSFTQKMYLATGRNMLQSFLKTQKEGKFFITYEGFDSLDDLMQKERFITYNLDEDEWLKDWLKQHEDVIPEQYGGKLKITGPPKDGGEKFRRHASRWFRKIVTIHEALQISDVDILVTVDSDCIFKSNIPEEVLVNISKDVAIVHHTGKYRLTRQLGVEAGFTVYNLRAGGREFLEEVVDIFRSGAFRKLRRWDDSFVLSFLLQQGKYPHKDVVPNHQVKVGGHVVKEGPFRKYIEHHKGSHHRVHKIIKGF